MVRERPLAAAATAAGAAAAGLFLWSRRAQISQQLNSLGDQIGEWSEHFRSGRGEVESDDTAGLTTTSARSTRGRGRTAAPGMSETGGGNASLGARSGGGGAAGSASGRGQVRRARTT
jgi:hypothetical protein